MADQADVRRIALALPGVEESREGFAFRMRGKLIAWAWPKREAPGRPRVPQPDVLAVRVPDQGEKAALLAADPETFFTEPHYDGYPVVLVRLAAVDDAELAELLTEAWRIRAPKRLIAESGL